MCGARVGLCVVLVFVLQPGVLSLEYDDSNFPPLFHLDEYSRCLSKKDGLYCRGTFHLTPATEQHHDYDVMKEYSLKTYVFNRTLLHRGYCVSMRCPSHEDNSTYRFEQCVQRYSQRHKLIASLEHLDYCKTHQQVLQEEQKEINLPQRIFLCVVFSIVLLNVVGSTYDAIYGDSAKGSILGHWSLRNNWRRLTATYEDGDPRLSDFSPLQGYRVACMLMVMIVHSCAMYSLMYLRNPRDYEVMSMHPLLKILRNGTSLVQTLLVMSSFLFGYNLLLYSKKTELSMRLVPKYILYRLSRLMPVCLLVIAYTATWWPSARSGPHWYTVDAQTALCRKKFWAYALFINNLVDNDMHCMIHTWYVAADLQLYIVGVIMMIFLGRSARIALPVLGSLFVLSSISNGVLSYVMHWDPMIYDMVPETIRINFVTSSSFGGLYSSPWGNFPACCAGLFLAHLHYHLQENGFKVATLKWLPFVYKACFPGFFLWPLTGQLVFPDGSRLARALYVAIDRPMFSIMTVIFMFGMINNVEGSIRSFFGWRGWRAMGRMMLSVYMVHWIVTVSISAGSYSPLDCSVLHTAVDVFAISCLSYTLALPLTLMVEMPLHKTLQRLLS